MCWNELRYLTVFGIPAEIRMEIVVKHHIYLKGAAVLRGSAADLSVVKPLVGRTRCQNRTVRTESDRLALFHHQHMRHLLQ